MNHLVLKLSRLIRLLFVRIGNEVFSVLWPRWSQQNLLCMMKKLQSRCKPCALRQTKLEQGLVQHVQKDLVRLAQQGLVRFVQKREAGTPWKKS